MTSVEQLRAELAEAKRAERKAARIEGARRRTVSGWILAAFIVLSVALLELATFAFTQGHWVEVVTFGAFAILSLALLMQACKDWGYRQCERDHDLLEDP